MDAALEPVLEGSLAAASRMDLGLHHEFAPAQSRGHAFRLGGGVGHATRLGGDAEFGKEFSGLEFVDIHGEKVISLSNYTPPL